MVSKDVKRRRMKKPAQKSSRKKTKSTPGSPSASPAEPPPAPPLPEDVESLLRGPRLYVLGYERYVQHDGSPNLPPAVRLFVKTHRGELPPFIPLPKGPVVFRLGGEFRDTHGVRWDGKSPLPEPVLRYIRENGTLPRHANEEDE